MGEILVVRRALAAVCPCRRSDQAAMDIIDYVATESAGLASTSTRTITAPVVGLNASRHDALELSGPAATLTL
jgi:hypothetical protein